jgi:integrase
LTDTADVAYREPHRGFGAEINQVAATTGDDPGLDTLILRLHTETACRRGGALALRPADLDREQCLALLREKGGTVRWQPVSPPLMAALARHAAERHAPPDGQLLRYTEVATALAALTGEPHPSQNRREARHDSAGRTSSGQPGRR